MNDIYDVKKNIDKILRGSSTNFLDAKLQLLIKRKLKNNSYHVYSPYKNSEKVIFYVSECPNVLLYEIKSKIPLKHQDIMGSLFSLGVNPNMYGDILIIDNHYYIYILPIIEKYLVSNLSMVRNGRVELEKKDINYLKNYERKYYKIKLIVSSNRIDTVLSHLININRKKILVGIKNKDILVNYEYPKNSYYLKEGDIFSIKRYGKYKYIGVTNYTKKNNLVVEIYKYI